MNTVVPEPRTAAALAARRRRTDGINNLIMSGRGPRMSVLRVILVPRRRPGTAARGEQHG